MLDAGVTVRLPSHEQGLSQEEEYCELVEDGAVRRIRFHDYGDIFDIPGLYETLFSDMLHCASPELMSTLLVSAVDEAGMSMADLDVLDLGAGNGLVGEALRHGGVRSVVAVDILEEAAQAAKRDRPEVYDHYYVGDMRELDGEVTRRGVNCMVCVAALGFGDIPPDAFDAAYRCVAPGGWVVFNIKSDFLRDGASGFARLIRTMIDDGRLEVRREQDYQHRLAVNGDSLSYVAFVGRKPGTLER